MTVSQPDTDNHDHPDNRQEERRQGPEDRRRTDSDRRNAERLQQDPLPRRDPDRKDRRNS